MARVGSGSTPCVGWQVAPCDPIWQVMHLSSEMCFPWRAIVFKLCWQRAEPWGAAGVWGTLSESGSCSNDAWPCLRGSHTGNWHLSAASHELWQVCITFLVYIQGGSKNGTIFVHLIISPIINLSSKFFYCQNHETICNKTITTDLTTHQVCCYTTLWNVRSRTQAGDATDQCRSRRGMWPQTAWT